MEILRLRFETRLRAQPLHKGKRSAVAGVNDSPVDCQSRNRASRRRHETVRTRRSVVGTAVGGTLW